MPFGGAPGWMELLIVGVIALLLFGKRLPSVMGSLGQSVQEFQKGIRGVKEDVKSATGVDSLTNPINDIKNEITS